MWDIENMAKQQIEILKWANMVKQLVNHRLTNSQPL